MNTPSNNNVISVHNLECCYEERVILRQITFSVREHEVFFVAGRSGCGKSTLLRHLVGLRKPTQGRISYFGREFTGGSAADCRAFVKSFGVLFQESALWTDLSLAENVALPLVFHTRLPKETRAEIVGLKLAQVGLAGSQDRMPRELSGGMQKRAALARALALDPAILFFDEPTAGLDPITARQIDHLILQVRDTVGTTVVVVSHALSSLFTIADRMILLDTESKGIIAEGVPAEIVENSNHPLVRQFFRRESPEPSPPRLPNS